MGLFSFDSKPDAKAPEDEPRVKGAAFREFLLWYEEERGAEAMLALWQGLPRAERERLRPGHPALGVLASRWYPSPLPNAILEAVYGGLTQAARRLAIQQATRVVTARALRGLYRVVFETVTTPELYARHLPRLWRQLHSSGERELVLERPGLARSVVRDWPGHHPMLCELVSFTTAAVFEAMKHEGVEVELVGCATLRGAECTTLVRWQPR